MELETLVAHWKRACEAAAIDKHPVTYVAHYNHGELLGWAYGQETPTPKLAIMLSSPFAMCPVVTDTAFITDSLGVLEATHLISDGIGQRSVDWRIPWTMNDRGAVGFSYGYKQPRHDARISQALDEVGIHRITSEPQALFEEAMYVSLKDLR